MAALDNLTANIATLNTTLGEINTTLTNAAVPAAGVSEADVQSAADSVAAANTTAAQINTDLAAKFPPAS